MSGELNELLKLVNNVGIERELDGIKYYEYYKGQYSMLRMLNLENIISNKKFLDLLEYVRKEHNRKSSLYIPPIFPMLDSIEFGLERILSESYKDRLTKLDFVYGKEFCSYNLYMELLNEIRKIYNITVTPENQDTSLLGNFENRNNNQESFDSRSINQENFDIRGIRQENQEMNNLESQSFKREPEIAQNFRREPESKPKEIKLDLLNFFESSVEQESSGSFFSLDSKKNEENKKSDLGIDIEKEIFCLKDDSFKKDGLKKGTLVFCSLLNTEIDNNGICFDISMVVDGMANKSEAPREIFKVKNYKEICINCSNHKSI